MSIDMTKACNAMGFMLTLCIFRTRYRTTITSPIEEYYSLEFRPVSTTRPGTYLVQMTTTFIDTFGTEWINSENQFNLTVTDCKITSFSSSLILKS